jgi:hypothetical protein
MRDLYIKAEASTPASAPVGMPLLQTGQTTSYRTGDDITRGRLTDFNTLASNNPWGNTNRFTDTAGTQTYANGIVIDWSTYDNSTVLCYFIGDASTYRNWNTSIDLKLSATIGGMTTWYLWNAREMINLLDFSKKPYRMNYAPFNFGSTQRYFHTSTDYDGTNSFIVDLGGKPLETGSKTSAYLTIYVRVCTVTGTTLS